MPGKTVKYAAINLCVLNVPLYTGQALSCLCGNEQVQKLPWLSGSSASSFYLQKPHRNEPPDLSQIGELNLVSCWKGKQIQRDPAWGHLIVTVAKNKDPEGIRAACFESWGYWLLCWGQWRKARALLQSRGVCSLSCGAEKRDRSPGSACQASSSCWLQCSEAQENFMLLLPLSWYGLGRCSKETAKPGNDVSQHLPNNLTMWRQLCSDVPWLPRGGGYHQEQLHSKQWSKAVISKSGLWAPGIPLPLPEACSIWLQHSAVLYFVRKVFCSPMSFSAAEDQSTKVTFQIQTFTCDCENCKWCLGRQWEFQSHSGTRMVE